MTVPDQTAAYFDDHAPQYSLQRLEFLLGFLARTATAGQSLIEIGCGVGNLLEAVRARTPIRTLWGCDVSQRCLNLTRARIDCTALKASILNWSAFASVAGSFDYVLMAAVLHHLVGRTRRESMGSAAQALRNAVGLLKPGGHLLLCEPVYGPSALMGLLFYVKRGVTSVTASRVGLFGNENNLGAPVVSYFTRVQLADMVATVGAVKEQKVVDQPIGRLMRIGGVRERATVSLVVGHGSP